MSQNQSLESSRVEIEATVKGMAAYAEDHREARQRKSQRSWLVSRAQQALNSDTFVRIAIPVLIVFFLLLGLAPWVGLVALTTKKFLADW